MEAIFRIYEDILVVKVIGDVDHHTASRLREGIDESMKRSGCLDLVMDFSNVEMMDSSGIGVVLGRYKKMSRNKGRMCISGCSALAEKVLEMAGVFSLVKKCEDEKSAIDFLKGQEQICMEV